MKRATQSHCGNEPGAPRRAARVLPRRRAARAAPVVALAFVLCGLFFAFAPASKVVATPTVAAAPGFVRAASFLKVAQGDSANFSHSTPRHAEQSCDNCHQREGASSRPSLPGHKACDDCHLQQFMTSGAQFCTICHTDLGSARPPVKAFPALKSFNAKFDHSKHEAGPGRPQAGCASCHQPVRRGVALTIPAGSAAHQTCYQCHAHGASSGELSSCRSCHELGRYARTPTDARAYRVSFSHASHRRMSCDQCHGVRAGVGQGRQVTSPAPTQHFGSARGQNCMTCHNNRRAFGGEDFADCKRCHKGQTFRF